MNAFPRKITPLGILVLLTLAVIMIDVAKPRIASFLQSKDDRLLMTIGKWQANEIHADENGPFVIRKTVEFLGSNTIIYNQILLRKGKIQKVEYYNLAFRYRFVSEDQIELSARVSDSWKITKDGQNLIISEAIFVGNGEYKRVVVVSWHLVAMSIAFLVFCAFRILYISYLNHKKIQSGLDEKEMLETTSPLYRLANTLITVLIFGIRAYLGTIVWSWWPMLFIRTPWDGVILLEINLLILSHGLKLIIENTSQRKEMHLIYPKWQYYIGVSLGSLGLSGSVISLLLLSLTLATHGFLL